MPRRRKPVDPEAPGHYEAAFTTPCGRIGLVRIPKGSDDTTRLVLSSEYCQVHRPNCPKDAKPGLCLCPTENKEQ